MTDTPTIDAARLPMLLTQLRLPTVARLWRVLTKPLTARAGPRQKPSRR